VSYGYKILGNITDKKDYYAIFRTGEDEPIFIFPLKDHELVCDIVNELKLTRGVEALAA